MNFITQNKKPIIIVAIVIIVIIIIIVITKNGKEDISQDVMLQKQIENSKDLEKFVKSDRNNFAQGTYSLDTNASKITWKYGSITGSIPVTGGALEVIESGRIKNFDVNFNSSRIVVDGGDKANISAIDAILKGEKGSMNANLILPNTIDTAFSVSFGISVGSITTSVATGLFVENNGDSVVVRGDVTLSPKTFGFPASKENLVISPNYVFQK